MDRAELLALCASSIYRHNELSVEEALAVASDIISAASAEVDQREHDAAAIRQRRAVRTLPSQPTSRAVADEEIPF